jgi:Ca2+-binding RTX toxin-like protein
MRAKKWTKADKGLFGTDQNDVIVAEHKLKFGSQFSTKGSVITAGEEDDFVVSGNRDDVVDGGGGDDVIFARGGRDSINGGGGDDIIIGGRGADLITGGIGNDIFVYSRASDSRGSGMDTIRDFSGVKSGSSDTDKIDLRALLGKVVDLEWGGMQPTSKGVWFSHRDGNTFVQVDTNRNSRADMVVKLEGLRDLTNSDFLGVKNCRPTITSDGGGDTAGIATDENGTAVTTVTATDLDLGAVLTYAIVGGADADLFTVDETTGVLSFVSAPDFESPIDSDTNNVYNVIVRVTDGIAHDHQTVQVTVADVDDDGRIVLLRGTEGADSFDRSGSSNAFYVDAKGGDDSVQTGAGQDIVRPGEGIDSVRTGIGDDVVVVVGQTATNAYSQRDINNLGGMGIDLSAGLTLAELDGRTVSDVDPGESIDGGGGTNCLITYGFVDLTDVTLANISQLQVTSAVTVTAQQLNDLGLSRIIGDGQSVLNITNPEGEDVTVNLSSAWLAGFRAISVDAGVTLVVDQADIAEVIYIAGSGSIQASAATGNLDLTGKYLAVTVLDDDGAADMGHGGNLVAGDILIGADATDILTGSAVADRIEGGNGDDVLNGGDGDDVLRGGKGVDAVYAGAGDDTIVVAGDLSGGGKIDTLADSVALGQPLTDLNGLDLNEDADGAAEVVDGGDGDDTLFVYGTADLSSFLVSSVEHLEIRSDVTIDSDFASSLKTVNGDGVSALRIVSVTPVTLNLDALGVTWTNLGEIEIGANVTLEISSLDQLGGARVLSGAGVIRGTAGTLDLTGFTSTATLQILNSDDTPATGGEVLSSIIRSSGRTGSVVEGTEADDYVVGTSAGEILDGRAGDDILSGKAGDDTYRVWGTGTKTILDSDGVDTLDLSGRSAGVVVNLTDGGTIGTDLATVRLGAGGGTAARLPLDILIMEDLSGSFSDDVGTVRALLDNLIAQIRNTQPNTNFGAASFVDKPLSPFGGSGDYVYRTDSKISSDAQAVKDAFARMVVQWGNDGPEAQLEALFQVALRTIADDATAGTLADEIGYRSDSMRIVVIATDADFHDAGDFARAGPNDGDTVLDGTPPGTGEDYPSIAQVRDALTSANLYPIFAVTAGNTGTYQALVSGLGRGDVVTLTSNSSNLIAAVQNGIENYKVDFIENLVGTREGDTLAGNGLANNIEGREGNDTLSGLGGNDSLIGGGDSDVAVFRGSRSEYDFSVAEDGALVVAHARGAQEDGTDNVKSVEYLRFADSIEDVPVEDFYPDSTLPGITEKYPLKTLAWFSHAAYDVQGWEQDSITVLAIDPATRLPYIKEEILNARANYAHAQSSVDIIEKEGWQLLSGTRLGLTGTLDVRGVEYQRSLDYAPTGAATGFVGYTGDFYYFESGYYASKNAAAMVAQKGDTLVVSFRGTNDGSGVGSGTLGTSTQDSDDWLGKDAHYEKLLPLVEAIYQYVIEESNGVEKLYVTGHSLGGAMVTAYLTDMVTGAGRLAADGAVQVAAVAFAAPGYTTSAELPAGVAYYLRFELDHDSVPDTPGAKPGTQININTDSLDKHAMQHYLAAVSALDDVGLVRDLDSALAYATTVDRDLTIREGNVYPEGSVAISDVTPEGTDPFFVVGANGSDILTGDKIGVPGYGAPDSATVNDVFYPGAGRDVIYGGTGVVDTFFGVDTVVYSSLRWDSHAFAAQVGESHYLINVDGSTDQLYDIEQLHFVSAPSAGADLLAGRSGADAIDGLAGNDQIYGGSADDQLSGGPGDDRIHGGTGIDTTAFNSTSGPVSIENWAVKVESTDGVDHLYSVEQLEFTNESVSTVSALREIYSNSDLLKLYAPVLALDSGDYVPTKIEAFLDHAILFETGGVNDPVGFGKNIGGLGETVYELDPLLDDPYTVTVSLSSPASVRSSLEAGNSYYLDFINGNVPGREDTNPGNLTDTGTWADSTRTALSFNASVIDDQYGPTVYARAVEDGGALYLQYYFFYLENDWTDYTDLVGGYHEADWEFMQIELDSNTLLPVSFMTSTHIGYAQIRNPFDTDISHIDNHIVVYVADGGHGTYLTQGDHYFVEYLGNDMRSDDKLLFPDAMGSADASSIVAGDGATWDGAFAQGSYELINIAEDEFASEWLSLDVLWGKDYAVGNPISNPPPSPAYNEDGRWSSPDSWLADNIYEPVQVIDNLADSEDYALSADGHASLAGLPNGEMEMGFLFDDTSLAALGHFDLV